MRSKLIQATLAAALALGLGLAAPASQAAPGDRYVLVTHAADSDSWWNTIKNSIKQAGEDFGVDVDYRGSGNGDLSDPHATLSRMRAVQSSVAIQWRSPRFHARYVCQRRQKWPCLVRSQAAVRTLRRSDKRK